MLEIIGSLVIAIILYSVPILTYIVCANNDGGAMFLLGSLSLVEVVSLSCIIATCFGNKGNKGNKGDKDADCY